MSDLREAVEWYDSLPPWALDNPDERIVVAFAAARRLLEAEEREWCATHDLQAVDGECEAWLSGATLSNCRPVPKLLVDPQEGDG